MKSKLIELVFVALTTTIASFLKETIFKEDTAFNYTYSVTISIMLLLFLYLITYIISRFIRIDSKYRFLGNFIETMSKGKDNHISFFSVKHSFFDDRFQIRGDTFDAITGKHYAEWWSLSVGFLGDGKLYYLHSAILTGKREK